MSKMSIGLKARTAHVKRWQIVRVAREQNLAEHTFVTMLIAEEAAKIIGFPMSGSEERVALYDWAIHHDIIEVVTGDLNTAVKARIKSKAGMEIIDDIETGICERYDRLKRDTPAVIKAIVKCADLIEAIAFLQNEGIGCHAENVRIGIEGALDKLIEECIDAWPLLWWGKLRGMPDMILEYE